jgi:hypothetical protein
MKRIEAKKTLLKKIRLRFSRTGGLNASAHPVKGITINNKYGLRVSKSFKGLTLGFQGKNSVFRGRWSFLNGFLNINLSKKSGISMSTSFKFGAINWSRPQYSSFRFLGIQIRGKKAHEYAVLLFLIMIAFYITKIIISISLSIIIFCIQLISNSLIMLYRFVQLCYNIIMYYIFEFFYKKQSD